MPENAERRESLKESAWSRSLNNSARTRSDLRTKFIIWHRSSKRGSWRNKAQTSCWLIQMGYTKKQWRQQKKILQKNWWSLQKWIPQRNSNLTTRKNRIFLIFSKVANSVLLMLIQLSNPHHHSKITLTYSLILPSPLQDPNRCNNSKNNKVVFLNQSLWIKLNYLSNSWDKNHSDIIMMITYPWT